MGYGAMVVQRDHLQDAIFRQVNKDNTHHDALEFPDGKIVLLTTLKPGQQATVLQLPADPQKAQEKPPALAAVQWNLADAVDGTKISALALAGTGGEAQVKRRVSEIALEKDKRALPRRSGLNTESQKSDAGCSELQTDLDSWITEYNEVRPNQGPWCFGKTPMQTFLDAMPMMKEKMIAA